MDWMNSSTGSNAFIYRSFSLVSSGFTYATATGFPIPERFRDYVARYDGPRKL